MSLQAFFDSFSDSCDIGSRDTSVQFNWTKTGCGFGSFTIYVHDGVLYCDSETMSREFVKDRLMQLVDECIFTDRPDEKDQERLERANEWRKARAERQTHRIARQSKARQSDTTE